MLNTIKRYNQQYYNLWWWEEIPVAIYVPSKLLQNDWDVYAGVIGNLSCAIFIILMGDVCHSMEVNIF